MVVSGVMSCQTAPANVRRGCWCRHDGRRAALIRLHLSKRKSDPRHPNEDKRDVLESVRRSDQVLRLVRRGDFRPLPITGTYSPPDGPAALIWPSLAIWRAVESFSGPRGSAARRRMKPAGITDAHRAGNEGLYPMGSTFHPTAGRVGAPGQQRSVSFKPLALVVSGRQGLRRVRIGRRVLATVSSIRCRRSGLAVGAVSPTLASPRSPVITGTIPAMGTSRRGASCQHKRQDGQPDSSRRGNRTGTGSESDRRRCAETNTL